MKKDHISLWSLALMNSNWGINHILFLLNKNITPFINIDRLLLSCKFFIWVEYNIFYSAKNIYCFCFFVCTNERIVYFFVWTRSTFTLLFMALIEISSYASILRHSVYETVFELWKCWRLRSVGGKIENGNWSNVSRVCHRLNTTDDWKDRPRYNCYHSKNILAIVQPFDFAPIRFSLGE
jgi:hypothetical protein